MEQLPYLSYSRLSTYASCGEKYRLMYVEGVPRQPQGAFLGGISVHSAIEQAELRSWALDPECFEENGACVSFFREHFRQAVNEAGGIDAVRWGGRKSKAYPQGHDYDWWLAFAPGMLGRFHKLRLADDEAGYKIHPVYGVEKEVNALLPSGTRLTTRLDALVMVNPDGEAGIRDYKTGNPYPGAKYQNTIYAYAVDQTLSIPVVWGELVYLGGVSEKAVRFPITTARQDAALTWMDAAEKGITKEVYVANPGPFCSSCPVLGDCPIGTQALEEDVDEVLPSSSVPSGGA